MTRIFLPNAVLIPANAVWRDRGQHVDPEKCTKLYLNGDRIFGEVFTQEEWEKDGKPSYVLHDDAYFVVSEEDEEEFFCRAGLSIKDQEPLEGDRIQLLPDMWCVKIDETEYWADEFCQENQIKRIFGVYVLNRRKHVHLCEATLSYECYFLGSQWEAENEDDSEKIDDIIRNGDHYTEKWSYLHVVEVDRLLEIVIKEGFFPPEGKAGGGYQITGLMSVTEEDAIEEIREGLGNGDL